jgi:hypothetical protein
VVTSLAGLTGLTSQLGIRLVIWMGAPVLTPAPYEVVDALQSVEVTNDSESGDGFQLAFLVQKDRKLDYGLLTNSALKPGNRVAIGVLMGVVPEVLIDGIIEHHQVQTDPSAGATLTVTGKDVTSVLDLEEKPGSYPNQPDWLIVTSILLGYPQYGLLPDVRPTTDVPIMLERITRQQETDLAFIRGLAERNGYVFYIEPVTFGVNRAYWGPESRLSLPQPALTQGMGASTNVTSLSFSHDALEPVSTKGLFVEPFLKLSIPIPPLPSLKIPPLAASPAPAMRTVQTRDTAKQNPARAATSALAAATNAPDALTGEGELDAVRYGRVLRSRRLVGVRGAGLSYDGFYYVRGVTHQVERGKYTQRFRISREGTGSLTPVVVP